MREKENVVRQVTKKEVYYGLVHQSLDVILEGLAKKQHYADELKKLIDDVKSKGE